MELSLLLVSSLPQLQNKMKPTGTCWGSAQWFRHLPCQCKVSTLIPGTRKQKKIGTNFFFNFTYLFLSEFPSLLPPRTKLILGGKEKLFEPHQ